MTRRFFCVFLCSFFFLSSCDKESTQSEIKSIKSGTSFGECIGYCVRDLEITHTSITYTASGWNDQVYPIKTLHRDNDTEDWEGLVDLIDMEAISGYEDIVGCPDCADGGAEWIRIETDSSIKQITFEYGDTLAFIQPLIENLRLLRMQYESELFP